MNKLRVLLGLVITLAITSCSENKVAETATKSKVSLMEVKVEPVAFNDSHTNYKYSGIIEPLVNTELSFQSLGTVQKVYVDEGDVVKKGQVLAELNNVSAQSSYNAALATQKHAQDAYNRLKVLYDKGSLPEIEWEEMKSNLEQANASAAIAKQTLENTKLKAPYNGVIGTRNVEIGSSVNPAVSAFDIVKINSVYARISVPENEISKFEKGQIALINIPAVGARNYEAKVERIGVIANQLSKTYTVKLKIFNNDLKIKPGMVCDTEVEMQNKDNNITVPMQAVLNQPNSNPYVYVLNKEQGKVTKRPIIIGTFSSSSVQVIAGLSKDELIVVTGQQKLTDNMSVTF